MNTTSKQQEQCSGSKSLSRNPVQIRIISAKERKRFKKLMGEYHYLGDGHSAGDTMRMVAERDGEWVGLLMWGSACYRLKPRDEFIGWTATQRARRQKLVVRNRRFALLAERGQHPNLASQHSGALPAALALDGKFIRDTVGVVCLVDHETGVPRAMIKAMLRRSAPDQLPLCADPHPRPTCSCAGSEPG